MQAMKTKLKHVKGIINTGKQQQHIFTLHNKVRDTIKTVV